MLQIERHEKIIQYVNKSKKTTTEQLARKLNVSKVTIRRDIEFLSQKGLLIKVHGGAVSLNSTSLNEIPFSDKVNTNSLAKQRIGIAAANMIEAGDIIILDSGSTTLEIAKNINRPNVTVLTNDLKIAMELASKSKIHTILCGGSINHSVYTLIGNSAVDFFKKVHVNKTFLGCDALDLEFGVSDRSYEAADIKRAMLQAADQTVMVSDCSKFSKKVFCYVCDISSIDKIVTDRIDDAYRTAFSTLGVDVITSERAGRTMPVL